MDIDYQKKAIIPGTVMHRELQGESVLLNLDSEYYFGLDEVGSRMWNALATSDTISMAFATLINEYDVDPDQLKHDLDNLLQKLIEAGLIELA